MKLLRYGDSGAEKWGAMDAEGQVRTLDDALASITAEPLSPGWIAKLQELDPEKLPLLKAERRIGPAIPRPMNFICIGLNYADHAAETGAKIPKEPIIFLKALSAFNGPFDDIKIPRGAQKTDWEVELGVVIGTKAAYVSEAEAMDHVAGYCVVNDVSERAFQTERGGTWDKGKGCETFGPVGPYLVTKDEVPDPQNLDLWAEIDGKRMQNGNTRTMIFGVRTLVSYVSQFITLHPGDIIATGTPPGVGLGIKPEPVFLRAGQEVVVGIQGMGEQRAKTVAA
ncbi:MAG: 2-hydroxyhepta-2,4-diene-1,7-dioate isomerase [Rhodospirillales bacterium 20-64-7]|jgi:2-keto-4-pentenoate hydratase/2-oxohepta-3-ene-1,7-dioic acid hydratase in catechol pathway|nr:MAG: 2-hydroxyhepta-2,4-diene-1,7-dioate isomerase [Rhodospirillales bacterium 20-64-7]